MTEPGTRRVYLPPPEDSYPGAYISDEFGKDDVIVDGHQFTEIDQTAIPWCTTHDRWTEGFGFCRANDIPDEICEVSTGGPDHKWWQDT